MPRIIETPKHVCSCGGKCKKHDAEPNLAGIAIVHVNALNVDKVLDKLVELREAAADLHDEIDGMIRDIEDEMSKED